MKSHIPTTRTGLTWPDYVPAKFRKDVLGRVSFTTWIKAYAKGIRSKVSQSQQPQRKVKVYVLD